MKLDVRQINSMILELAKGLKYEPRDLAPSTELELFNAPKTLPIWTGESDNTIYQDETVNWAFRAIHDMTHIETGLGFTVEQEVELGRIQAARIDSDLLAKLFHIEIAGQAEYYLKTGQFVENQIRFTMKQLLGE
jgi:hypothetical protein